mmetsp:Transcript_2078/g.4426  ORF Transcript_2078/g.4426 Transcript_2078/m.4426 type:complete len:163 (+) Transcript_2078:154-642(+)
MAEILGTIGPAAAAAAAASTTPLNPDGELLDSIEIQLHRERQRNRELTAEVARLKRACGDLSTAAEVEEERMVNRMLGRLLELRKEKEALAIEVELEEEHLTNTMQRRLAEALLQKSVAESRAEGLSTRVERLEESFNTLGRRLRAFEISNGAAENRRSGAH